MNSTPFSHILHHLDATPSIRIVYIELFLGEGSSSDRLHETIASDGKQLVSTIACIFDNPRDMDFRAANHPNALHFVEDIRHLNPDVLTDLIKTIRERFSNLKVILWVLLNQSDFLSESSAHQVLRFLSALQPDRLQIEIVEAAGRHSREYLHLLRTILRQSPNYKLCTLTMLGTAGGRFPARLSEILPPTVENFLNGITENL